MTIATTTLPAPAATPPSPTPPLPPRAASVLKAMLWKEFRETLLIAALIALATGLVLGVMSWNQSAFLARNYSNTYLTAGDTFIMGTMSALAPIAALLLGFVQFILESRPDRLGLITHRPVSRSTLFWCKAAAGMLAYLPALLVPLLLTMFWASIPYNIPLPFSWSMLLPPLTDILSGIPFYLAGALIASRSDARWYGSRILPLVAPVVSAIANFAAPSLAFALLSTAIAILILLPAARGTYLSIGQYPKASLPTRATLGLTLLVAFTLGGGMALALLEELLNSYNRPRSYSYDRVEFTITGEPVLRRTGFGPDWHFDAPTVFLDMQGRRLDSLPAISAPNPWIQDDNIIRMTPLGIYDYPLTLHEPANYFRSIAFFGGAQWHIPHNGNYLVGFDPASRRRVGAIGANGFQPDVAVPDVPFPGTVHWTGYIYRGRNVDLISAGNTLYNISPTLQLQPIFTAPEPIQQIGALVGRAIEDNTPSEAFPLIKTDHHVIILSSDTPARVLAQQAIDHLSGLIVEVGRIPATGAFIVRTNPRQYPAGKNVTAYILTPDGKPDHQTALSVPPSPLNVWSGPVIKYFLPALAPPALVNLGSLFDRYSQQAAGYDQEPDFWKTANHYRNLGMLLSTSVGILTAAFTVLLARRRQIPRSASFLWTTLALLLGPLALLLLLATRGLNILTPCPKCQKPTPTTSAFCPHCAHPIPLPPATGTEIFT